MIITKTRTTRLSKKSGFTLVELLTVIAVIGILAAIVIPSVGAVNKRARIASARQEVQAWTSYVAAAANDLGGTLPLTGGLAAMPTNVTGANLLGSAFANFNNMARLEQVLIGMPNPLVQKYMRTSFGAQVSGRSDSASTAELVFNGQTKLWENGDVALPAAGYDNVSRLECLPVNTATAPGSGVNYRLTGTANLRGSRVASICFRDAPGVEAYELAEAINGADRMAETTNRDGTTDQVLGQVTYAATGTDGVTDVWVYLGHW